MTNEQEEINQGALRGTAMHRVMECYRFSDSKSVEEQVEKGIVVQAAPGYTMEEPRQKIERPKLPTALPEELIEVIQNFTSYRRELSGLMKTSLKNVELSVSPEGELVVGIPDGYESDYFTRFPENIQVMKVTIISLILGQQAAVHQRLL